MKEKILSCVIAVSVLIALGMVVAEVFGVAPVWAAKAFVTSISIALASVVVGVVITALKAALNELEALRERERLHLEYEKLLGEELDEVVHYAASHGWKSSRYQQGVELRRKLGIPKGNDLK
jgi:hypothetical protein